MKPILVIDDDDDLREVLRGILEARGDQIIAFADAAEALRWLRQGPTPALILLDLMMPGMTGWDFRQAQKSDPLTADIPVVVLTARTVANPPEQPSLDGLPVLHKPFELKVLLATVDAHRRGGTF